MTTYYLDTSILLDAYEKRKEEILQRFILKIIKENATIILSDINIKELKYLNYSLEEIKNIFKIFKLYNIRRIHISRQQLDEMKKIASYKKDIPKKDILHAIIARDNNAIIITRDKHFQQLTNIVELKKPEEL